MAKTHLLNKQKELDDYKSETLKVIRGESRMSADLLNTLVAETKAKIQDAQSTLDAADLELKALREISENRKREYDRLLRLGRPVRQKLLLIEYNKVRNFAKV